MSSRFADPTTTTMRTRSPICHDEGSKRPPPSPSNKAPPPKKLDAKAHVEEPCPKLMQPIAAPSSDAHGESCIDKSPGNRPVIIDMEVFGQILDLDEEDNQDFSQGMVEEYRAQARGTIKLMDENHSKRELTQLGKHGHFLKGSSASLGVLRVQEICEKIQHLGNRIDPDREPEVKISVDDALARIKPLLARLKDEYAEADTSLKKLIENP